MIIITIIIIIMKIFIDSSIRDQAVPPRPGVRGGLSSTEPEGEGGRGRGREREREVGREGGREGGRGRERAREREEGGERDRERPET